VADLWESRRGDYSSDRSADRCGLAQGTFCEQENPAASIAPRRICADSGPSDWRNLKYERLTETPLKWREIDSNGAITYERVETVAPTRIVNRIADPSLPFGGSWTYEIAPSGNGTELTITENGEVSNPLFRFVSRFIMGYTTNIEKYQRDLTARFK
jgi:hypothetical protein